MGSQTTKLVDSASKFNDAAYWRSRAELMLEMAKVMQPEAAVVLRRISNNYLELAARAEAKLSADFYIAMRYSEEQVVALVMRDALERLGGNRRIHISRAGRGYTVRTENEAA